MTGGTRTRGGVGSNAPRTKLTGPRPRWPGIVAALGALAVILSAAWTAGAPAAAATRDDPVPVDARFARLLTGGSTRAAKTDTVCLLGGPTRDDGKFENAEGDPDDEGWIGVDLTDTGNHWRVDTFQATALDPTVPGNHAMWCGDMFSCEGSDPGGYGDNWNDGLDWYGTVPNAGSPTTVSVTARLLYDTEPDYDFVRFKVDRGGAMVELASWTGSALGVPEDVVLSFEVAPSEYVGPGYDQVHLRWEGYSDFAWSDQDCNYVTDGLAQLDNITVTFGGVVQSYDDFEPGSPPAWTPAPSGVGDFSKIWSLLADLDPCAENASPQFAFIDDGLVVQGTGGSVGTIWTYGPGEHVHNLTGGLAGSDYHLDNEIWSPPLDWPVGGYAGGVLAFDVYRHLPWTGVPSTSSGVFYKWHVRCDATGAGDWGSWRDNGFVYYSNDGAYLRSTFDITSQLQSPCARIQIALGAIERGWAYGMEGESGTPAPYFDNVCLQAVRQTGPGIATTAISLFNDGFPATGGIDLVNLGANSVRLDMARNIRASDLPGNDPGDSIIADVVPAQWGSVLAGSPVLHVLLKANPLFDPYRDLPAGFTQSGDLVAGTVTASAVPSTNRWSWDLPDTAFFFPGDVLHYYIRAEDSLGGVSLMPADTAGFGCFRRLPGEAFTEYSSAFTVRALPTLRSDTPGDQPAILFWNDSNVPSVWNEALAAAGFAEGRDYDVYFTQGPSSAVGNGLGGRATPATIDGYRTLLYTSGDLGSYTLSNGTYDRGNDIGLLDAWLSGGDRNWLCTGDDVETNVGAAGIAFHDRWLSVTHLSNDVRPDIGDQTEPVVRPLAGGGGFATADYMVDGGCPVLNDFDQVSVTGSAALAAEFTAAGGVGGVYTYAAAALNDDAASGSRVLYMPYDLRFVEPVPGYSYGRAELMADILAFFGHTPGGAGPTIGWARLHGPPAITVVTGETLPPVHGRVFIDGVTALPGATADLVAELGYGPDGSDPTVSPGVWQWFPASFSADAEDADDYSAILPVTAIGEHDYCCRFAYAGGAWVYGDLDGSGNGYATEQAGALVVAPVPDPVPPVGDDFIPEGAATVYLTFGDSPEDNAFEAPPFTPVSFFVRSTNGVQAYGLSLEVSPPGQMVSYDIGTGNLNVCPAPSFAVATPGGGPVLLTGQIMTTTTDPVTITLHGLDACAPSAATPLYSNGTEDLPFFVANSLLVLNPGCAASTTVDVGVNAPVTLSTLYDEAHGLEYVIEAMAPIDPLDPVGTHVYVEMPEACAQAAQTGFFQPAGGGAPVMPAQRVTPSQTGLARFAGYFLLDESLLPGYYELLLELPGGGTHPVPVYLRYAGYQGYQPAGTLTNAVTGNTVRGASVSIWREVQPGQFTAFASMVATDGTYGFTVPSGTYKIVVEYEAGGVQERGPFTVSSPIPLGDIVLVPVTNDTAAPAAATAPPVGDVITGTFTDSGVGLAVVEPVPESLRDVTVFVEPYAPGAPAVDFRVVRAAGGKGPSVIMRGIDRLGNVREVPVAFEADETGYALVCLPDPQTITLADDAGGGVYRASVDVRYLGGAAAAVYGYSVELTWDGGVVSAGPADFTRPASGAFHDAALFMVVPIAGGVRVDAAIGGTAPGLSAGDLFAATFTAVGTPALATTALTITPVKFRDSLNNEIPLAGLVPDHGQIVVDLQPPVIAGALVENITLAHTDDYLKNADELRVTAVVTQLDGGTLTADLSQVSALGAAVPPTSYDPGSGLAVWGPFAAFTGGPAGDGTKTVTIHAVDPLGNPGSGGDTIVADNTPPSPLTGLTAAPGNRKVALAWTSAYDPDPRAYYRVLVRFRRWTDYPVYAPAEPAYPADAASGDGTAVEAVGDVAAAEHGRPYATQRDIYYYGGFVQDWALNSSPAGPGSAARATCYWLGDVCGISAGDTLYNGLVDVADISLLGAAYGGSLTWPANEADVGPTHDNSRVGIPTTDGVVDFEDLMIFAMNFSQTIPKAPPQSAGPLALSWTMRDATTWILTLDAACPQLQGLSVAAPLPDGAVAVVTPGALLAGQSSPLFLRNIDSDGLNAGLALLGANSAIAGAGELLVVTLPSGVTPGPLSVRARSVANEELASALTQPDTPPVPSVFALEQNVPNPFNPQTRIVFALPEAARARLAVYALDGSRVRVLVDADLPARRYEVVWDGRDDRGQAVASGAYVYRLEAGSYRQTRKMLLMK